MPRLEITTIKKIGITLLVVVMCIAGILPGALLIIRINSNEYWTKTSPELVRMDSSILKNMIIDAEDNYNYVYSILVMRNGFIVEEWYDTNWDKESLFRVYSVSKSVTSALIGIAIDKGYITSLNELVLPYFPDKDIANLDAQKESITIEHLLAMTAGLHWPEYFPYGHPQNPYNDWKASEDHVEYVLNRTMVATPGQTFNYNTGATHLLTAILERSTNMSTSEFANRYLFGPLYIEDFNWLQDPQGVAGGGDGLYLRTRDMAKIGYLFLKSGKWEGKQIISENWVRISTSPKINVDPDTEYGYQWWITPDANLYSALGYGEQQINIFYEEDLIVVFTGMDLFNENFATNFLSSYILPSLYDN